MLNEDDLLKVCVNVGGGTGCGSGTQNQLLGLINTRLALLPNASLLSLCLDLGSGGCGTEAIGGGGGAGGGNPGATIASLSDADQAALKIKCRDVMRRPSNYTASIIEVCRLLIR